MQLKQTASGRQAVCRTPTLHFGYVNSDLAEQDEIDAVMTRRAALRGAARRNGGMCTPARSAAASNWLRLKGS